MKKIIDIIRKKQVFYILFASGGFLLGWLLFSPPYHASTDLDNPTPAGHNHGVSNHEGHTHDLVQDESGVWTCSMHPQIRQDKPGQCPICGMDLIPLKKGGGSNDATLDHGDIQFSEEAIALADVQTTRVSRENPVKKIRLYGKIAPDERSLQSQTAYVNGRIEELNVDFTGETVRMGQTLATVYSPDLFTAQQELLEAVRMNQASLVQAAREKLHLWNMTEEQINTILRSGKASPNVEIKANTSGIVMAKRVNRGDYVQQGAVLFDIANLSRVWAIFDAFETDLPFISRGDKVSFSLSAIPGRKFTGQIAFVDPIVNATTRTARVRVDVSNTGQELKPEMYATAEVDAPLKGYKNQIVVPQTAVLWTGKRSIVYVRQPDVSMPTFRLREVELGPSLGGSYVILSGLADGDEIVTNGVFSIDSSAQLEGKVSMMSENNAQSKPMTGHEGHHKEEKESHFTVMSPQIKFGVKGSCEMCKDRIEKAAMGVNGVSSASWDKANQIVYLELDTIKTSADAVAKAIAKVGHDTDKYKADKTVYDKLPGCCKYRN